MSDVVDQGKSMLNTIAYARAIGVSPAYPDSSVEQVVRGLVAEVERLRAEIERLRNVVVDAAISQHREALKGMPDD